MLFLLEMGNENQKRVETILKIFKEMPAAGYSSYEFRVHNQTPLIAAESSSSFSCAKDFDR